MIKTKKESKFKIGDKVKIQNFINSENSMQSLPIFVDGLIEDIVIKTVPNILNEEEFKHKTFIQVSRKRNYKERWKVDKKRKWETMNFGLDDLNQFVFKNDDNFSEIAKKIYDEHINSYNFLSKHVNDNENMIFSKKDIEFMENEKSHYE